MTALSGGTQGAAATAAPGAPETPLPLPSSYADVADFGVDSATIIVARIRNARELDSARAPGVPPQLVRVYVEAEVQSVIYGRDPVAQRITYLVDVPRQANGRAPKLKKLRVLLFARPVTVANQIQLVSPGAQLAWDAGREATARGIAAELAQGAIPPRVTGIAQAFFVPGTVSGESETQIFLRTETSQPVSLSILRRPGEAPRWAAAFGEIVDESAAVPARRTLPWYRLACGLPPRLTTASVAALSAEDARNAAADYAIVTAAVGACDRTPPPPPVPLPAPRR